MKKISLVLLCSIILLGICGCDLQNNNNNNNSNNENKTISKKELENIYDNLKGTWVLQGNVEGAKSSITISNVMVGCGGDATDCLHGNGQYMVHKNTIFNNYVGSEVYVCLELKDNNTLIQANCKDEGNIKYSEYSCVNNMNISYKRK